MTCPSTQVYQSPAFVREVYAWTALGILIFIARFAVRLRILSWRKLQGDDYMAVATLILFICCIASKMTIYYIAPNSDFTEDELLTFTKCQMANTIMASKIQVFLWYAYASFLWGLKAMVLFFVARLPLRPYQRRLHKLFAILSGLVYVTVILVISCTCIPFRLGWATIPYPPPKCTSRTQNFYSIMISNAATDFAILTVALPLLWQLRVSIQRRIELTLLLCSGIFVTTAALTSLFMSLTDPDSTININLWGTREEIAGIAAVNAPIIRPLFRRAFWKRDFDPSRRTRLPPVRLRVPLDRGGLLEDLSPGRNIAAKLGRKIGVITSLQSSKGDSSTGWTSKSGTTQNVDSTVGSQRVDEDDFKDLEWAWGVAQKTPLPRGPRPLLPDPVDSDSSGDTILQSGGLESIIEEEEEEITIMSDDSVVRPRGDDPTTGGSKSVETCSVKMT